MQIWFGEVPVVVVSTVEGAQEILKNQDLNFAERHVNSTIAVISFDATDMFFSPYNERWRQLRKLSMQELLTTARVRSFQAIREQEVARLMRDLAVSADAGAAVNLSSSVGNLINDIVMLCSVGSRCRYREEFLEALETAKQQLTWITVADLFPSSKLARMVGNAPRTALASRQRMERIIEQIIQERKDDMDSGGDVDAAGKESFVNVLLRLQKEGGTPISITNETIVGLLFDIFSGGSETSSTTLIWMMVELIRWPRVMAKAQAEVREALKGKSTITEDDTVGLSYIDMVIKETLRLHSPVPLLTHSCRETCKVMGYDVLKGTSVFVNVSAICRDPRYWEDAEEFKPERFETNNIDFKGSNFEFIPFGSGRRICPGMNLGLANMKIVLASLLYHFDWKLPDEMAPKDLDVREAPGIVASKLTSLHICPVTRVAPTIA
ncbi:hypothetical protein GUJ93_ZPchr0006g43948 [Zizania palustris]|uniref:Cytochrome P450 n=1 Tax=Zizania palustris TaxID=103762 RepID=A0A8J5STL2_ZIZPA|nr:hypothetical protein GUJ93_ZPchr0006g43948 [Zizania palustris]